MKYFITCRGHCGSTLLMRILMNCGLEAPDETEEQAEHVKHGLEGGVKDISLKIENHVNLNTVNNPSYTVDDLIEPNIPDGLVNAIKRLDSKCEIAKNPHAQYCFHIWLKYTSVKSVIIPKRDLDSLYSRLDIESDTKAVDTEHDFMVNYFIGSAIRDWAIDEYDVNRHPIHYPTFALDPYYAWKKLSPILIPEEVSKDKFIEVHDNCVNEDYIRNKDRCRT